MVCGAIRELWPGKIEERSRDADYVVEFPTEMLPPGWE